MGSISDTYLAYQFVKRLTTPFEKWEAFKVGAIDAHGTALVKRSNLTPVQAKAWGRFDVLVANLKRLLAKLPGGQTRIATIAATVLLLKEHNSPSETEPTVDMLAEMLDAHIVADRDLENMLPENSLTEGFRLLNKTPAAPEGTYVPHKVDVWHQSRQNGWCVQVLDKHGNQCGEAEYHYRKGDANHAKKRLNKEHSLTEELETEGLLSEARKNIGGKLCVCGGDLHTVEHRMDDSGEKITWHRVRTCSNCHRETPIRKKALSSVQKEKRAQAQSAFDRLMKEDAAVSNAGGGAIAGIGVGPQGEPGMGKKAHKKYKAANQLPTKSLFTRKSIG